MKIGIIGSGMVAQQLALGFMKSGHEVMMGSRNPSKLDKWTQEAGAKAQVSSFEDAAKFGEMIVLATKWDKKATENAIDLAGKKNFANKIVIDVTNPLTSPGDGQPLTLAVGFPQSAGLLIQKWLPDSKVVKAFNIVTAYYMANPNLKEGTPDMFIAGNDISAKKIVFDIASNWGWEVHDIGNIEQAYMLESLAMLWITYGALNNHWNHAFKLLKK